MLSRIPEWNGAQHTVSWYRREHEAELRSVRVVNFPEVFIVCDVP